MVLLDQVQQRQFKLGLVLTVQKYPQVVTGLEQTIDVFFNNGRQCPTQLLQGRRLQAAKHAEIKKTDNAAIEDESISRMRIGLEKSVLKNLL